MDDEIKISKEMGCKILVKQLEKAEKAMGDLRCIFSAYDDLLSYQSAIATKEQRKRVPVAMMVLVDPKETEQKLQEAISTIQQSLCAINKLHDITEGIGDA